MKFEIKINKNEDGKNAEINKILRFQRNIIEKGSLLLSQHGIEF